MIELNWGCCVQDSVPADIRPRGNSIKRKATLSDGASLPELPWQRWSLDLLTQLEKLSSFTKGKLVFAQELMTLEVRQRQDDIMNTRKSFAEILRSDLERINKDFRENKSVEPIEEDDNSDEDDDEDENEYDAPQVEEDNQEDGKGDQQDDKMELDHGDIVGDEGCVANNMPQETMAEKSNHIEIKRERASEDADVATGTQDRAREIVSKTPNPGMVTKSRANLQKQAKILRLRADAMRLKQEAAKRKAEAYELEAKMYSAEAKQHE